MTHPIPLSPRPAAPPATLRERVEHERAAYGLSYEQIAAEAGRYSAQTLAAWARGDYAGRTDRVEQHLDRWLATRIERRSRGMAAAGIDRHAALDVTEQIAGVLAHAQASGDVVLVHGRPGAGKSWAARWQTGRRTGASLMVATPALGGSRSLLPLLARLAIALGSPAPRWPSLAAAEAAVLGRLADRSALIVVDEAHHLSARALDQLRCIRDIAGCGLALLGGDELWSTVAGGRLDQLAGRLGYRLPVAAPTEHDITLYARTVLDREPGQRASAVLRRAAAGPGGLHAVRRVLARSWAHARQDDERAIDDRHILAAEAA